MNETSKQRVTRLKKEELKKFAKKKRDLVKKPKSKNRKKSLDFASLSVNNFRHGFSDLRKPRYNNSRIFLQRLKKDGYKSQKKRVKGLYPTKKAIKRYKRMQKTKRSWYKYEHQNKKRHGKLFYLGIKNFDVPHLFQRHSNQLYLKHYIRGHGTTRDRRSTQHSQI